MVMMLHWLIYRAVRRAARKFAKFQENLAVDASAGFEVRDKLCLHRSSDFELQYEFALKVAPNDLTDTQLIRPFY